MTDSLSIIYRLIDDKVGEPTSQLDHIYQSSNGDLWQLVREKSPKHCLVRHTPNVASGGAVSDMSVEAFLAINGSGPEHEALRLLLGNVAVT